MGNRRTEPATASEKRELVMSRPRVACTGEAAIVDTSVCNDEHNHHIQLYERGGREGRDKGGRERGGE